MMGFALCGLPRSQGMGQRRAWGGLSLDLGWSQIWGGHQPNCSGSLPVVWDRAACMRRGIPLGSGGQAAEGLYGTRGSPSLVYHTGYIAGGSPAWPCHVLHPIPHGMPGTMQGDATHAALQQGSAKPQPQPRRRPPGQGSTQEWGHRVPQSSAAPQPQGPPGRGSTPGCWGGKSLGSLQHICTPPWSPALLAQGRVLAGEVGTGSPRPGTGMANPIGAPTSSQLQLWGAEQQAPCPCHCQHPWVPWGTCHAQGCCLPG